MKAEALIELNRQDEALPLINQVRARANNSKERTRKADGNYPSNFLISEYQPGVNITWDQATARKALQWERRLEFAMESPRFFDLVRWGIAAETLNAYLAKEKTRRSFLALRYSQRVAMNIILFLKGKLTTPKGCISKTQDIKC